MNVTHYADEDTAGAFGPDTYNSFCGHGQDDDLMTWSFDEVTCPDCIARAETP